MDALKSFVLTRKGLAYIVTIVVSTLLYLRGDLAPDVYLGIVAGSGGVFQVTTAWEDSASKKGAGGSSKVSLEVETETQPITPADGEKGNAGK